LFFVIFQTDILNSINEGHQIDCIYTDFRKAFDKVNHKLLLIKLYCCGVHGVILKLIESYLYYRTQQVKLLNTLSEDFIACSGVPQGSHLDPLLFLIFINDLPSIFNNSINVLIFPDDTKMYTNINTLDDCQFLQNNINYFAD
jgi:hypothetical protein